eukprot:CAMPEP_0174262504 /NCGR_PEP_ID=MMETSP0439-20130205/13013_1 /TAXON_ID=0 /ORGANISM="Stereomyxa ramosa, Strain Chinc5" /LENGTH=126 /DNA_ID=CAMNT_0015347223 /DNA_START=248 /DNA_END=625 /DNA_ORIENTATION=+
MEEMEDPEMDFDQLFEWDESSQNPSELFFNLTLEESYEEEAIRELGDILSENHKRKYFLTPSPVARKRSRLSRVGNPVFTNECFGEDLVLAPCKAGKHRVPHTEVTLPFPIVSTQDYFVCKQPLAA